MTGERRGASGDTRPYAIEREVEDLSALIDEVGGSAAVFGYSSGGVLALAAAAGGASITHLAIFEAPFTLGDLPAPPADLPPRLTTMIEEGRPGDVITTFQTAVVRLPAAASAQLRESPAWPAMEAFAQSVVYDVTITTQLGVPTPAMTSVGVPTLVLVGAGTWPGLRTSAQALAELMPAARYEEVAGGADHDIPTDATAAILHAFVLT